MGGGHGESATASLIGSRHLEGVPADAIAREVGVDRHLVEDSIARFEAVLLLIAHGFPEDLTARATRIEPEEARAYSELIRSRLGGAGEARAFAAARGLCAQAPVAGPNAAGTPPTGPATPAPAEGSREPDDEATQALEVLDFWASKWL